MTRPMLVSCAVAALLATAHEAVAQTPHVQLSVGGGVATDARGITSRAATVAPSLAWSVDPRLSLGIAASGTRYQDAQWSLGGSATASARVPLGALVALTFDGAGAATTTSFDAAFQTLDAIPALELHVGPVAAFAGAHAAYGRSSLVAQATTPFGAIPGTTRATGSARTATGPVFGGSARLTSASEMLILGYREEHASMLDVRWADRVASVSLSNGPLSLAGSFGTRAARDEHSTFGSGSMSVALPHEAALELEGGTYPSNRLTGLAGGRYLSAGISFGVGSQAASRAPLEVAPPAPPAARGVAPAPAGYTRLTIRADDAERVEVAGDFDGWKLVPARRAPDGVWFVDLQIAPGRYRYAFRVDGTAWRIPDGAAAVDDGFGGKSAWLTVRGRDTAGIHDTTEER